MDSTLVASWIGGSAQIFFLDLLLGGDNAIVIALACRTLPARDVPRAVFFGTAGAIVLRVLLTTIAGLLITLPYLELASALILVIIAINLSAGEVHDQAVPGPQSGGVEQSAGRLSAAITVIVLADAIMSLDNIVALAAVSGGNVWFLGTGLVLSIPILVYGGALLAGLLKNYPALVTLGAAVLGWTAGGVAVADPAIAAWVAKQAPALTYVLPLAGAIYVVVQQGISAREPALATPPVAREPNRWIWPRLAFARRRKEIVSPPLRAAIQTSISEKPKRPSVEIGTRASAKVTPTPESQKTEDRVVLFGLVGLFAIMGIFIAVVLYMAAGSFHPGG